MTWASTRTRATPLKYKIPPLYFFFYSQNKRQYDPECRRNSPTPLPFFLLPVNQGHCDLLQRVRHKIRGVIQRYLLPIKHFLPYFELDHCPKPRLFHYRRQESPLRL